MEKNKNTIRKIICWSVAALVVVLLIVIYAMTAIGEESGTLDSILEKASLFFEDEADAATAKMTAAIEPIMLIVMAILVGLTVGAIALPIFTMAQFIA